MSLWRLNFLARSRRFARAERGNVAMLWALCGAALIGLTGLTVDFTRAQSIRNQMQNAADGAVLVAERMSSKDLQDRREAAEAFYNAELGDLAQAAGAAFDVIPVDTGGHRVTASYTMPLSLARIIRNEDWVISVSSEAEASASPPIEVALVLDNTGSMSNDMDDLREAAEDLADYLLGIDGDSVSVALVPFVAQVNIGNSNTAWVDTAGTAPFNGELLEDRRIASRATSNGSSSGNCNYSTTFTGSPYPIVWVKSGSTCYATNPSSINYYTLFQQLGSSGAWKGCVEARPAPYDINDTAPSSGTPATMFVPFFWMDLEGNRSTNSDSQSYITDTDGRPTSTSWVTSGSYNTGAQLSVWKYRSTVTTTIATGNPDARGPNRGCPTPIVPLTTNKDTVITAIQGMRHWDGGGTNQVEGLAWGWRVLSPTPPFTQGRDPAEDDVRKVLVMMTDGENTNLAGCASYTTCDNVMGSDYSAYSHLHQWTNSSSPPGYRSTLPSGYNRNDITSTNSFVNYINSRQETLCTAIKNADIEIYTIQFRDTSDGNETRLRNCASGADHFFAAANAAQLQDAFTAIGSGIGNLRLTK